MCRTRIGTSHFITLTAAVVYYGTYGQTSEDVIQKVRAGEISIGPPNAKSHEAIHIDEDGRYQIETNSFAEASD